MQEAKSLFSVLSDAWHNHALKKKIIFTFAMLMVFRACAFITVPAIDIARLRQLFSTNQFLVLLDIFSGGTLVNFSILAIGLNPYINASIAIQLLTSVYPPFEALSKEGEYGRFKLNQYTRFLTVPIAFLQAIGMYFFFQNQSILEPLPFLKLLVFVSSLTAGTFILVWVGELISEYGVGNGISLIILTGIVGRLPVLLFQSGTTITQETILPMALIVVFAAVVIYSVVVLNEAQRRIPVYYAKRVRGGKLYGGETNYLPLKLSQAGVIPIIFAVSFVLFPQLIGNVMNSSSNSALQHIGQGLVTIFATNGLAYNLIYFFLVVLFTFFYSALVFSPQKIAEDIQKYGGFIPGIRPGQATKGYLEGVLYRLTAVGAISLGLIAILPNILSALTGARTYLVGGTSILILVSVILETYRVLQSSVITEGYNKLQTRF